MAFLQYPGTATQECGDVFQDAQHRPTQFCQLKDLETAEKPIPLGHKGLPLKPSTIYVNPEIPINPKLYTR